ncbi:uncharacterized protein LOC136087066 [Hydra vulgaris]|uniref:Uncharacterized protein LOC136087066 n=1 Tax=Hydra vulgaris TaxID=6087 RepID=A0ABM4CUN0_HYDVU
MTDRKVSNNKSTLNKDNDVAEERSDKNDDDISDIIATETNFENENFDNYSDLASWPDLVCTEFINNCLTKETSFFHYCDSNNLNLESARMYKDQKRYFSNKYFKVTLKNGQTVIRSRLCYSKLKGHVYCLVCKMFSNVSSLLTTSGFSDWMNILRALESHNETVDHKNNMLIWLTRKNNINVIDKNLESEIRKSVEYYYNLLIRVVAIIKFLSERAMSLRGHDETWGSPRNRNFMGLIELISEFDPFLREHLTKCQSEKRNISYLSKTQSLFNSIKNFLTDISLPIENIRGQSYDNAANMSGKYSGLQARLKEINKYADFVPCAAHSLYLVGVEAAKSLSITSWSMHHDSVKALKNGYNDILKTLNYIYEESEEKFDCKREANILFKKLIKLKNAILTIIWDEEKRSFSYKHGKH